MKIRRAPLILLVDGFDDAYERISDALWNAGFDVESARDLDEAAFRAPELAPDLILVDEATSPHSPALLRLMTVADQQGITVVVLAHPGRARRGYDPLLERELVSQVRMALAQLSARASVELHVD